MLGTAVLMLWVLVIALWLSTAAEFFLCPAVAVLSRLCNMSEQVAGVTLLAFANGAGDVAVTVAAAIASNRGTQMALGESLGSSMFVSCLVLGIIAFYFPFEPTKDFLRDICFLLVAVVWLAFVLLDSAISTFESCGFVALYAIYLFVVLEGHFSCGRRSQRDSKPDGGGAVSSSSNEKEDDSMGKRADGKSWLPLQTMRGWQPPVGEIEGGGAGASGMMGLLEYVNPINDEIIKGGNLADKVLMGLRSPAVIAFRVTVPVVDEGRAHMGWNKEALMCQLILAPCVLVWSVLLHRIGGVSPANAYIAYAVALVLGAMAASCVHITSRPSQPPAYQRYTSIIGFLVATAWIYIMAVELVHALQAIGRVLGVSDAFLGLTVLGSSQSLGDFVTNIAIARAGMPVMAAAACIAAPLLDILFGVGLAGLLGNWLVASPFAMELNVQLYVTECFLIFALVSMLCLLTTNGMKAGKNFGAMLLIVYTGFIVTILILEIWFGQSMLKINL